MCVMDMIASLAHRMSGSLTYKRERKKPIGIDATKARQLIGELSCVVDSKSVVLGKHLVIASGEGKTDKVKALLRLGANVNFEDAERSGYLAASTAMQAAAAGGHADVIHLLLDHGADINQVGQDQLTPLTLASWLQRETIVALLLDRGADANVAQQCGSWTALQCAARGDDNDTVVRILLAHGAHINKKNDEGMTALHLAAMKGYSNVVKTLVDYGASGTERNAQDFTAADLALRHGHLSTYSILQPSF